MTTSVQSQTGLFISFEGGDGCGKTTQARLLGNWLAQELGLELCLTREPGGTALGKEIRNLVLHGDDMGPHAEALLYAADRAHHVATLVRPALARGELVITDRYMDSSVAYQGFGRDLTATAVRDLSMWATQGLVPHLTVLLDLDPAVGASRFTSAPDRLERAGEEFHRNTRAAFLEMASQYPDRWVTVDAHGTIDDIALQVQRAVIEGLVKNLGAELAAIKETLNSTL